MKSLHKFNSVADYQAYASSATGQSTDHDSVSVRYTPDFKEYLVDWDGELSQGAFLHIVDGSNELYLPMVYRFYTETTLTKTNISLVEETQIYDLSLVGNTIKIEYASGNPYTLNILAGKQDDWTVSYKGSAGYRHGDTIMCDSPVPSDFSVPGIDKDLWTVTTTIDDDNYIINVEIASVELLYIMPLEGPLNIAQPQYGMAGQISYSRNGTTWSTLQLYPEVTINKNEKLYIRQTVDWVTETFPFGDGRIAFNSPGKVKVGGCTSKFMVSGSQPKDCSKLFFQVQNDLDVSELSLDYEGENAYASMFAMSKISTTPQFSFKNARSHMCEGMFSGCYSLTVPYPEINVEVVEDGAFHATFTDCPYLTKIPVITADTVIINDTSYDPLLKLDLEGGTAITEYRAKVKQVTGSAISSAPKICGVHQAQTPGTIYVTSALLPYLDNANNWEVITLP